MALPQTPSPQSSLGHLGAALLKAFKPVITVPPHSAPIFIKPEQKNSNQNEQQKDDHADSGAEENSTDLKSKKSQPGATSGIISVKRDPSVPWVNVVTNLVTACTEGSSNARTKMGATAYNASSGKSGMAKRVVGGMIDLVTIIKSDSESNEETPSEPPIKNEKKDKKAA